MARGPEELAKRYRLHASGCPHPQGSGHPVVAGGPGSRKSVIIVPMAEFVE